jgi:ABC-type multidrug transport system ATPase subunit
MGPSGSSKTTLLNITLTRQDKLVEFKEIIEEFRLQNCANTPMMLISGGEKRRVNMSTELLTNPSVIFLDDHKSKIG